MDVYTSLSANIGNMCFKVLPSYFESSLGAEPSAKLTPHIHGTFELHTVFKDSITMEVEDQTFTMNTGDSVLVFPNALHRRRSAEENSEFFALRFSVEKIVDSAKKDYFTILSKYISNPKNHMVLQNNPSIIEHLHKIRSYLSLETTFSTEKIEAHLILLFTEMFLPIISQSENKSTFIQKTSTYDATINQIQLFFNLHYMENVTLSTLATRLCLSQKQTQHLIKKAFGTNFRECLSKVRLKTAKTLLSETNKEVQEIATEVGYLSYNGFYLAFKSKFGITPAEYRTKKRASH